MGQEPPTRTGVVRCEAVKARDGTKTTVLITHRLANIRYADAIYVLHDGQIVETGTHQARAAPPTPISQLGKSSYS